MDQEQVKKLLKKASKEFQKDLLIDIETLIGLNYSELFSYDYNFLFVGGAKNTKKSRVFAFLIVFWQLTNPNWHVYVLRNELKQHITTTKKAIEWVLDNLINPILPKIRRQYYSKDSEDVIVRLLPSGHEQYIYFRGLDKGIDKLSGSDEKYGMVSVVWWNEPINAEDRFKRGGINNEKLKYTWDIILSSLLRSATNPKVILDFNFHNDKNLFVDWFKKYIKQNKKILETTGKQIAYVEDFMSVTDEEGKTAHYLKALFLQVGVKVNEFITPFQRAQIEWRKKNDKNSYELLDLGMITKQGIGVFADLTANITILDRKDAAQEKIWKDKTSTINYYSQGFDYGIGINSFSSSTIIGISEKPLTIYFLRNKVWEGEKWNSSDHDIGEKKILFENKLAKELIINTIEMGELYPSLKRDRNNQSSHILFIDYQNHSFMGLLYQTIENLGSNINLDWIRVRLQNDKFEKRFNRIPDRIRAFRILLSKVNFVFDEEENEELIEFLKTWKGEEDDNKKLKDIFDSTWYCLLPYINFLLSPEELDDFDNQ